MKRLLILLLLLLLPGTAGATDHYINAAVSGGSDDGSDWTNAWATLPATLTRGDTYWIADGEYEPYLFNDAVSGDTKIWIKKATVAAHGTSTGWNNAYGDGQAVFTGSGDIWTVVTNNWVFDGVSATEDTLGHGFKLQLVDAAAKCLYLRGPSSWGVGLPDSLEFNYIEFSLRGIDLEAADGGVYVHTPTAGTDDSGPNGVTISHCYFHDSAQVFLLTQFCGDWTFEYNYLQRNSSSAAFHAEAWADYSSDRMIVRYNTFRDIEGTANIALMGQHDGDVMEDWEIYGNLFFTSAGNPFAREGLGNGVVGNSNGDYVTGLKFYNNTMFGLSGTNGGLWFDELSTGVEAYNNIWVNCALISTSSMYTVATHDNNHFFGNYDYRDASSSDAEMAALESNAQIGTAIVFADTTANNFTLAVQTGLGYTLASPYDVDRTGTSYSVSGGWSMGYDAYDEGGAPGTHQTWFGSRAALVAGTGKNADSPLTATQIADSVGTGDTLYDVTPDNVGANAYTITPDSVRVNFKTSLGGDPTIVGKLKPLTMTNLSTAGSDSVLIATNNDDSFMAEGHAYNWRNYYTSGGIDMLYFGEINTDRRTNIFAAFNLPESVTSVTSATLRCFVHYNSGANVKYDIRGILSKNVTPPSDSLTFQAFYADSLDAATAVSGTLSLAGGDSLNYEIATITDLVNAVLGVEGNTGRVGLMMLTDITGGSNAMRIEAKEEGAGRAMAIYYEYGTESDYWAYAIPEAEQAISKVYRDGVLMTSVDYADLDDDLEYTIRNDSLFVRYSGDGITADAYGPQLTISGNHCTVYGGVFVHGNQSGAIKVSGDAATIVNCVFDSSSVGIALLSGADNCVVKNNVFAVSDTALADNAAETTEDYNFNITGFDNTGLAGAHDGELAAWDTRYDAPESWRDLGTPITGLSYYGSAPEPGASELEALVVDTTTFRRGYGVGRWGDALQKRWGGSPW